MAKPIYLFNSSVDPELGQDAENQNYFFYYSLTGRNGFRIRISSRGLKS